MRTAWSREEVEATVSDYFDMLAAELRGQTYNKTAHRRALQPLLAARSWSAIERKHANISAVLIELGFPYIPGYKPYFNYQRLLFEVVEHRLSAARDLEQLVAAEVAAPAVTPSVDDILATMVSPPPRTKHPPVRAPVARWDDSEPARRSVNYLQLEAANTALGLAGEKFVIAFERARLIRAGCDRLAERIDHIARTRGDGSGFDILSYEESGQERLIEVKTTRYGALTPFYATQNEVRRSKVDADRYQLYRVHEFRTSPRIYSAAGAIELRFDLTPQQYLARFPDA